MTDRACGPLEINCSWRHSADRAVSLVWLLSRSKSTTQFILFHPGYFSLAQNHQGVFNGAMFTSPSFPHSHSGQSRRAFIRRLSSVVAVGAVMPPFDYWSEAESQSRSASKTLVGSEIYCWGKYAQREQNNLHNVE